MLANNASDGIGAKVLDALLSHGAPLLRGQQSRFRDAKPFPHIAVDNILPTWIMDALMRSFQMPKQMLAAAWADGAAGIARCTAQTGRLAEAGHRRRDQDGSHCGGSDAGIEERRVA